MVPLGRLTKDSILEDKIFEEIFDQEDPIYQARLMLSLEDRAEELGVKTKFTKLLNAYKKAQKEMSRKSSRQVSLVENWTNFDGPYDRMQCRSWIAAEDGICLYNPNTGQTDIMACYHPILPVERLKSLETGEERIRLAYKRRGIWEEIIVPKTMVTSAAKIVSLSGRGIAVTSENARYLVRYLADVENSNEESINVQYSTSKMGWLRDGFMPYDTDVVFDGDAKLKDTFEAIAPYGSRMAWYEYVKTLRATGKLEIKFMLAASFASVLISIVDGLPFFVDLWGETGGGKSVCLMLAASVWANPREHAYIKDYKGTEVGHEVLCDFLNHLPLMLDDTSKKDKKIEENFEALVYSLCSGKGKTRSNKDLGLNRENHWKNCILTNGERPLTSYVNQGGAINRILELECNREIYDNPSETIETLKNSYGHAGKDFIDVITQIGTGEVKRIQKEFQTKLADEEKMEKQALSLSIILTADRIATDYLFQDREYIPLEDAKVVLIDREELSDNKRCYQYILGEVEINAAKFDAYSPTTEKWGCMESGYVVIYNNIFDSMCKKGGFSKTAFLSWADKNGLIQTSGGKRTKGKRVDGRVTRCVFLKLDGIPETDEEGFVEADTYQEAYQEDLPFK
ncbi:DUF927 domain-containing protein [Blautia producta]|uniref:DUF927 domain-containing protein n=1 Tax=Blautia producta TaxID=33035 RepID=UPI001D059595|nr:DUF927 domain-containing protein [Blautia producta]MCB5878470.1 DUF927 domain-containing protein [Blautia producta]